jgi:hypothetical protein
VHDTLTTEYAAQRNLAEKAGESEQLRVEERDGRISALPVHLREAMSAACLLSDTMLKTVKSSRVSEEVWGPFLPWHYGSPSSIPAVTFGVDSPKLDILYSHDDRVHRDQVFGSFCGEPIVWLDELGMEVDEERELVNRLAASSHTSIPAEILPGEERCADGIIRRATTTEAMGYDVYHNQEQIEAGQQHVGMAEARKAAQSGAVVYWRPNRATTEVYTVGTELPCLSSEPEPFALIQEAA